MPHSKAVLTLLASGSSLDEKLKAEARRSSGLGPKMLQQKLEALGDMLETFGGLATSSRLSRKRVSYALGLAQLEFRRAASVLSATGWACLSSAREASSRSLQATSRSWSRRLLRCALCWSLCRS